MELTLFLVQSLQLAAAKAVQIAVHIQMAEMVAQEVVLVMLGLLVQEHLAKVLQVAQVAEVDMVQVAVEGLAPLEQMLL